MRNVSPILLHPPILAAGVGTADEQRAHVGGIALIAAV